MQVKIVACTSPWIDHPREPGEEYARELSAEEFIAYAARVSNPDNQANTETAPKLLKYLVNHKHWSPFEMVHVVMEVRTTRDISRQLLRHHFSFQEFSQRYAEVTEFIFRECRFQDAKNRQNSIPVDRSDPNQMSIAQQWLNIQFKAEEQAKEAYQWALDHGIAKEVARVVLPEGLTVSTLYVAGTIRNWIHYCQVRVDPSTQKEHRELAKACWDALTEWDFQSIKGLVDAK